MVATAQAILTLNDMETIARREVQDPVADPAGNTFATAALEFSQTQIFRALNAEGMYLQTLLGVQDPDDIITAVTMSYSESSGASGSTLPTAAADEPIARIEDIDGADGLPRALIRVTGDEIERHNNLVLNSDANNVFGPQYYALMPARAVKIRPQPPNGRNYRIWYLSTPRTTSTGGDDFPFSGRWSELLGVGAAIRLLRPSDRVAKSQVAAYEAELSLFKALAHRNANADYTRAVAGRDF